MRKLVIIHFSPIELYPPVLNWLNFLAAENEPDLEVRVFTMSPAGSSPLFTSGSGKIKIFRPAPAGGGKVSAYWNYLRFYSATLFTLIRWRPDTVLYYETLSAFPALFFKKYIDGRSSLFIHYHEYSSKEEYESGMMLSRWAHRWERKLYPRAAWISHTNADRIKLFEKDLEGVSLPTVHALPNYPPVSWQSAGRGNHPIDLPVKLVYVGALSLDTMYTRELAEWVLRQEGKVTWDIYSDNITAGAKDYIASLTGDRIRFRGSVNYYSLPGKLSGYDIGVILYKGHISNYVYNAPNKLFEYLACGLDVWFPDVMKGCRPYITSGVYPRVSAFDFTDLSQPDLLSGIGRQSLQYTPSTFYAEQVLPALLQKMKEKK